MEGRLVRELEDAMEAAVAGASRQLVKDGKLRAPLSERICHLMAKAAVAVFEAANKEIPHR
jgi:hypothetical protein